MGFVDGFLSERLIEFPLSAADNGVNQRGLLTFSLFWAVFTHSQDRGYC